MSAEMGSQTPLTPQTPMIRQYLEIKKQYPDAILFYRIGDFYEMFFEDAVTASKALDIVLTSRNKNDPNPIPLCGVPHHSVEPYLEKMIEKGFKVAICDQVEDPATAKGVVRREVTRVVTPGLSDNVLASVYPGQEKWGLSFLEISTGRFRVMEVELDPASLREELAAVSPREILMPEGCDPIGLSDVCVTRLPAWVWDESYARRILYEQFGVSTLSGFDCEGIPSGVIAAGAALHYVRETQRLPRIPHLVSLKRSYRTRKMVLGEETRNHLSLDELIAHLDRTKTAMGRRLLREWFYSPLVQKGEIERRLDAVEELVNRPQLLQGIQSRLEKVYDLERISSRLSLGTVNARDLTALSESLREMAALIPLLSELGSPLLKEVALGWDPHPTLADAIAKTFEGELIREGVHSELDDFRKLRHNAKAAVAEMEQKERARTGIHSLKIHFNRVFGYYLEVSSTHLAKVPADFVRKQTLANSERYITPGLKNFEDKILGAEERIKSIEYEIFCALRDKALQEVPRLQGQAVRVALLDGWTSLASVARDLKLVRPQVEDSGVLEIRAGRHLLVEKHLPSGSFVPNDIAMDADKDRLFIVTGPNMAGKSTVIRQVGLIVLMAQVGSFIPAESAHIGIVDRLFTRVGASDRLSRGESTFMVEMCETASILHHATSRSLILLDEIGRGTSTFDGISIAWAVAEFLYDQVGARTLFATHYHELIDLALTRPGIKNFNVLVKEEGEGILFLYRLVAGGASHSYGIHVARLAGLPPEVLSRAREVLRNLESSELEPGGAPRLGKKRKTDEDQLKFL